METTWGGIEFRCGRFDWSRPYVMGVLNLTPDSFSDGGKLTGLEEVRRAAEAMVEQGVDIIDVGGESTRPNAQAVSTDDECRRVLPAIEEVAKRVSVPISIDTTKALVAQRACEAGAEIVNDISGGLFEPAIIEVVEDTGAAFVCGHVRGSSLEEVHKSAAVGGSEPTFDEVLAELKERLAELSPSLRARTIVDPCLGFGKKTALNLELMRRSGELAILGPVLVGPSRKRFLGEITGLGVEERDPATLSACLASIIGGANIVRVHNVSMICAGLKVFAATHPFGPAMTGLTMTEQHLGPNNAWRSCD